MQDWMGGHMGWMGFGWILVFLLGIGFAWFLFARSPASPEADESPEAILKRRLARGEIARDEYERRIQQVRK